MITVEGRCSDNRSWKERGWDDGQGGSEFGRESSLVVRGFVLGDGVGDLCMCMLWQCNFCYLKVDV